MEVGQSVTGGNGRVEGFDIDADAATCRLTFELSRFEALVDAPFFPEISIVFDVADIGRHPHVPVLVSPAVSSTYLGN